MTHTQPFNLEGKVAAVLGVADQESIAWSIAKRFHEAGAHVVIGHQQKFLSRIKPLLASTPGIQAQRCDILNPDEIQSFFEAIPSLFPGTSGVDVLVHSIAFAPAEIFQKSPSEISSFAFSDTFEISVHSLGRVIRFAKPHLNPWSSVITLSYQASHRAMPLYSLMGSAKAALESWVRYLSIELGQKKIRINTLSPGPVETLAALSELVALKQTPATLQAYFPGVDFTEALEVSDELEFARACWKKIHHEFSKRSPLAEVITANDVADSALFLASPLSRKITGQILTVDCGFSTCLLM